MTVDWAPDTALAGLGEDLALELYSLSVDKAAATIARAFADRGIESILLKGPVVGEWLYTDGTPRPYGDADLLVAPRDWRTAQRVLEELGFERELEALDHPGMASTASEAWRRGSWNIDLHCTLWGVDATPEQIWSVVAPRVGQITLSGECLKTLPRDAQALLLATHAAKHGDGWAVEDLARGVRNLGPDVWFEAARLASQLAAVPAFVSGLKLVEGGHDLVLRLGLPDDLLPEAELRAWRVPLTLGLEQLVHTPGLGAKANMLARELWPTPAFLRWWSPLARRGKAGLAAAYIWRVLWIGRHAVPAWRAWRRVHQRDRTDAWGRA